MLDLLAMHDVRCATWPVGMVPSDLRCKPCESWQCPAALPGGGSRKPSAGGLSCADAATAAGCPAGKAHCRSRATCHYIHVTDEDLRVVEDEADRAEAAGTPYRNLGAGR
jgi:hypothetical protein